MTFRFQTSLASMATGLLLISFSEARAELFSTAPGAINPVTGNVASASADFELLGNNLVITLTNTLTNPPSPYKSGDVLTDIDFSLKHGSLLGTGSVIANAVASNGADITGTTVTTTKGKQTFKDLISTNVTPGWMFATGVTTKKGPLLTAGYGISATAYNSSGATATTAAVMAPDNTNGQIFTPTDGANWGVTPNAAVTTALTSGGNPYYSINSVTITLAVDQKHPFALSDIYGVFFTYGSEQGGVPAAVPEPSSMAIAGLGALGLIGYGIRRRRGA